jgi:hypothetical protein
MTDLVVNPCRQQCRWRPTTHVLAGEQVFGCTSCGSQWVASQPWAPVDADGTRHPTLTDELARARTEPTGG